MRLYLLLARKWEKQSYISINQMLWDIFLSVLIILSGIFLGSLIKRNSKEKDRDKLSSELQNDFEHEFEVSDYTDSGDELSSLIDWIEEDKEQDQ